jgi:hydrogenase nickel incorporation protein HypB
MFDFDMDLLTERVNKLNPHLKIIPLSAKSGQGFDAWVNWLRNEILDFQAA